MKCDNCGQQSYVSLQVDQVCGGFFWPEEQGPFSGYFCGVECLSAALAKRAEFMAEKEPEREIIRANKQALERWLRYAL